MSVKSSLEINKPTLTFNVEEEFNKSAFNISKQLNRDLEEFHKDNPGKDIFYTQPKLHHDKKCDSWEWRYQIGIISPHESLSKKDVESIMARIVGKTIHIIQYGTSEQTPYKDDL